MAALLTAFLPDLPAQLCWLRRPARARIGRSSECEFRIDHASVSRVHAELDHDAEGWKLRDCGSKNGSFVEGEALDGAVALPQRCWLRFGDVHCEFEHYDSASLEMAEARSEARRARSLTLGERLGQHTGMQELLGDTLDAVLELSELERGFVLLGEDDGWRVAVRRGLEARALAGRDFAGSVGVVQRAIDSRQSVVVHDVGTDAELKRRQSVIAGALRSMLALPVLASRDRLLAIVYADSREIGATISALDLEMLTTLAERAGLWLAAQAGVDALARLEGNGSNPGDWLSRLKPIDGLTGRPGG
jgi:hypothetical protein